MGGGFKYMFWFDTREDYITFLKQFKISLYVPMLYRNDNVVLNYEKHRINEEDSTGVAEILKRFESSANIPQEAFSLRDCPIINYDRFEEYKLITEKIVDKYKLLTDDDKMLLYNNPDIRELYQEKKFQQEFGKGTLVSWPNLTLHKYIELFTKLLKL